jgi:predicted lipoprotein with Yx(FWY)xxD motif
MTIPRNLRLPGAALAVACAALLLSACGSSSKSSSSTASNNASAASSSTAGSYGSYGSSGSSGSSASTVSLATAKGSMGTYLTGSGGRAIYLWVADGKNQSACSGSCAKVWPPVTASGAPKASGGAMSADLGTITRADGTKQVTYKGHPLYYYVSDTSAGATKGQGSNNFGAKWWLVAPSGSAITSGQSVSQGSSSTTSSSGGGWG